MRSEVRDRLDRTDDVESFTIEDYDPLVLTVESTSGSEYTVLPSGAWCQCDDHEHRDMPCKHLLAVATDGPLDALDYCTRAIQNEVDEIDTDIENLERELARLREKREIWADAASHLEADEQRRAGNAHGPSDFEKSGECDRNYGSSVDHVTEIARSATISGP